MALTHSLAAGCRPFVSFFSTSYFVSATVAVGLGFRAGGNECAIRAFKRTCVRRRARGRPSVSSKQTRVSEIVRARDVRRAESASGAP
jgi:hypothetical protein